MVICQGCGQAFPVPAGYGRSKIQCPGCGVICAVPVDSARQPARAAGSRKTAAPAPAAQEPAAEELPASAPQEPEAVPLFDDEPAAEREPEPAAAPAAKGAEQLVKCRRCGRRVRAQRECPSCDAPESPVAAVTPHALELDEPPGPREWSDLDEDASPYLLADKDLPICPKCKKEMPAGAVLCPACGFNRRTRKKHTRAYQPIARAWETDLTLQQRLMWLAAGNGFHFFFCAALSVVATGAFASVWPFVITWPLLMLVLCFLLGTYDRIEIVRDAKGRTRLTKRWRCFFIPVRPVTTDIRGFTGVTTGQWHDAGCLEYFVFISLLTLGLVPGFIWYYVAIHKVYFHVALAVEHGMPEVYVYRGRSDRQMNEIADVLCNASGLKRLG
jgi:ribosomal protein L32